LHVGKGKLVGVRPFVADWVRFDSERKYETKTHPKRNFPEESRHILPPSVVEKDGGRLLDPLATSCMAEYRWPPYSKTDGGN